AVRVRTVGVGAGRLLRWVCHAVMLTEDRHHGGASYTIDSVVSALDRAIRLDNHGAHDRFFRHTDDGTRQTGRHRRHDGDACAARRAPRAVHGQDLERARLSDRGVCAGRARYRLRVPGRWRWRAGFTDDHRHPDPRPGDPRWTALGAYLSRAGA